MHWPGQNFNVSQVKEVLESLVSLMGKAEEEIKEKVLSISWIEERHLEGKTLTELWSEERLSKAIVNICTKFDLEFPKSYRQKSLPFILKDQLESYRRSEVEDEDFVHMVKRLCQNDHEMLREAVDLVRSEVRSLGQYMAVRCNLSVEAGAGQPCKEEACQEPYNQHLHGIAAGVGDSIVISEARMGPGLKEFAAQMELSSGIAVVVHMEPKILSPVEKVDMVIIRTEGRVFAILPKVFPGVL